MPKGIQGPEFRLANRLAQLKRWIPPEEFARFIEADGALKWCSRCRQLLPVAEFHKSKGKWDGLASGCKTCSLASTADSRRKRLAQDPEYRSLLQQQAAESKARAKASGKLQVTQRKQALRAYGLTLETFAAMLAAQRHCCAICRNRFKDARDTHVDHDHACCPGEKSCGKCVRGILCNWCNFALGRFRDDPAVLRRAARYLEARR